MTNETLYRRPVMGLFSLLALAAMEAPEQPEKSNPDPDPDAARGGPVEHPEPRCTCGVGGFGGTCRAARTKGVRNA